MDKYTRIIEEILAKRIEQKNMEMERILEEFNIQYLRRKYISSKNSGIAGQTYKSLKSQKSYRSD